MKPLLLLDVDGVLNPYTRIQRAPDRSGRFESIEEFSLFPAPEEVAPYLYDDFTLHLLYPLGAPMPVALSMQMGADITALQDVVEIGYATTWETDVEQVAEVMGLPYDRSAGTVVIAWPQRPFSKPSGLWLDSTRIQQTGGSWKTPFVVDWMRQYHPNRPWLWADDDIRKVDAAYIKTTGLTVPPTPDWYVTHRVNPDRGLTPDDITRFREWAERLA